MAVPGGLFNTVARRDYLQFWDGPALQTRAVARFLDLTKAEVAHVSGVAPTSVRFDQKIPKQALDRLTELANLCGLVAGYFEGDVAKTSVWLQTKNPLLGGVSPREMILKGRSEKLRAFIVEALNAAGAKPDPLAARATTTPGLALIQAHRASLEALCQRYGVSRLALFGSALREDFEAAASDVDFTVEFGPLESLSPARQYFDFKAALEQLLGRPVDLVELRAMPDSRLKRNIERTARPVYAQAA